MRLGRDAEEIARRPTLFVLLPFWIECSYSLADRNFVHRAKIFQDTDFSGQRDSECLSVIVDPHISWARLPAHCGDVRTPLQVVSLEDAESELLDLHGRRRIFRPATGLGSRYVVNALRYIIHLNRARSRLYRCRSSVCIVATAK